MDRNWNCYNFKSTRRIYAFGVLKCSEKFNVLDFHVFWIMSRCTVSKADVILSCRCWIFLIFSGYRMFLMNTHGEKSSGERSCVRGGQGIGPPLPIQGSGKLPFKFSVTKQLKWAGDPSCVKITLLTISCSKVSICGNTYCWSKSRHSNGFKSRPSFSMTLYIVFSASCLSLQLTLADLDNTFISLCICQWWIFCVR